MQDSLVGKHLGDIEQRMGKKNEAAHAYKLALAATSGTMSGNSPMDRVKMHQKRSDELTARYQKLTGIKPTNDTRRLPNGQWTLTTDEQLQQLREAKIEDAGKLSGAAEFTIVFKPGKIDSVVYKRGDEKLEALGNKIESAHFQVAFPPDSNAILVRRASVERRPESACTVRLMTPQDALSKGLVLSPKVRVQCCVKKT